MISEKTDLLNHTTNENLRIAMRELATHFNPEKNRFFENHVFRRAKDEDGEFLVSCSIWLRKLSEYCDSKCYNVYRQVILSSKMKKNDYLSLTLTQK